MPMDQKRHLEAVGTSDILGRILICEVNNKVWTQGHSKAALWLSIFEMSNMEKCRTFGKWDFFSPPKNVLDHTDKVIQVLQRGLAPLQN